MAGPPAGEVVLAVATSGPGWHIGVLHRRRANGVASVVHLESHHKLRNVSPNDKAFLGGAWISPGLDPVHASSIAARCRAVAKKYQDGALPYGFRYATSLFDDGGSLQLGMGEVGLTCATFVLALYKSLGLELLDLASWHSRSEDQAFRERIIRDLEANKRSEHAAVLRNEPQCARYRPTEVAGASVEQNRPVHFDSAVELSMVIEAHVRPTAADPEGA